MGRPTSSMEYVAGTSYDRILRRASPIDAARLELFLQVCGAIQHAHQKGVIHRDIKPSNVLVAVQDGKPVPKIIDFGIAKATKSHLTGRPMLTQRGSTDRHAGVHEPGAGGDGRATSIRRQICTRWACCSTNC